MALNTNYIKYLTHSEHLKLFNSGTLVREYSLLSLCKTEMGTLSQLQCAADVKANSEAL